jgi:peptide methionine sulfoxide reductase msrA/msrB
VCGGRTGHAEAVLVAFDPERISYDDLLRHFWEAHDPTQGDRQGNDRGSQYRSAIFWTTEAQRARAETSRAAYGRALSAAGPRAITTQIAAADRFFPAEEKHQQYLHKVPAATAGCAARASPARCRRRRRAARDAGLLDVPETEDAWRERLSRDEYRVLRKAGTERPFSGEYVKTSADGTYRCRACGNPLFDSDAKFDSRTGWPSFTQTVTPTPSSCARTASSAWRARRCSAGGARRTSGHVFDDGPRDAGGQRFCMNSVALDLDAR